MCEPGRRGTPIKTRKEIEDNTETEVESSSLVKIPGSSIDAKPKTDFKLSDFSKEGIYGPNGFLAALESQPPPKQSVSMSMSSEPFSSSMSVSVSVRKSTTAKKLKLLGTSDDVNKGKSQAQGFPEETDPSPTQSSEEVVSLDFSPERSALGIDHIREFIFHLLDEPTLFTSRLVCHRWKYFASQELQKTVTFVLDQVSPSEPGVAYDPQYSYIGRARGSGKPDPSRSVSRLTALLENSTKSEFPCTSVNYYVSYRISPQSFFDTYGPYLRKLALKAPYPARPILFNDFNQILSAQAPNIEHLIFDGNVIVHKSRPWRYDEYSEEFIYMKEYDNDNEFKRTQFDAEISKGFAHLSLSHLKILEIGAGILETILKRILEAAPNLSEVKMTCDEFLHCLVSVSPGPGPNLIDRRHLLKELKIVFTEKSLESFEIFANASDTSELPLAIQKLCLDYEGELELKSHLIPRFTTALGKILKGCSASLQELTWGQMEFLTGLQFPLMPTVTKIRFRYSHKDDEEREDIEGYVHRTHPVPTKFFPKIKIKMGLPLGTTFPSLKHVDFRAPRPIYHIDDFCCQRWEDPDFDGIEIRMDELFQNVEPVESVTSVDLDDLKESESLRALFPRASFTGEFHGVVP